MRSGGDITLVVDILLNDLVAMEQNSAVFFLLQWVSRWKSCIMKGGDHSSKGSEGESRSIAVWRSTGGSGRFWANQSQPGRPSDIQWRHNAERS